MDAILFSKYVDESAVLTVLLQQAGFMVRTVRDLNQAIEAWPENPADFIFITLSENYSKDLMMIKQMRAHTMVPIVVLAEMLSEDKQVALYEDGIDLLVYRPYSTRLLLAQIRAALRRSAGMPFFSLPILTQGEVKLDPGSRTVQVGEHESKKLTQLEFRLLYSLMIHAGQIIPTENIVEQVWGYVGEGNRDLVRGLIQRIRAKVEADPSEPRYIKTEQGVGYYFER